MTTRVFLSFLVASLLWGLAPMEARGQGSADDFPHGPLPEGVGCADCHSTQGWSPLDPQRSFDHGAVTGFSLVGNHAQAPCASCHQDLRFSAMDVAPDACGSCHLDVHQGTLSANCSRCHTPEGFSVVSGIRIHQSTDFLLEGAHLQLSCESCHATDRGGAYSPIPSSCMACHREEFEAPKTVDHVTLGFPENCLSCHSPNSWTEVGAFNHVAFSGGFELLGAHAILPCGSCHIPGGGLRYPTPSSPDDCVSCHQNDYQSEHGGSGYPTTCLTCHDVSSWEGADDDHADLSGGFALDGAHDGMACTNCHTSDGQGTLFSPTGPQDCVACHQADYQREHIGTGYPANCTTCHSTSGWEGARVDHAALSGGYLLEGAHDGMACTNCHTPDGHGTLFSPTGPQDCVACHQAAYQQEHLGTGYPADCTTCHTTSSWEGVLLDHAALSDGYVLEGAHGGLACTSCHTADGEALLFEPTGADDCVSCHQADYQREHSGSGYPSTCTTCHTASDWQGVQVDHAAISEGYVLEGVHDGLACGSCHTADGSGTLFNPTGPDDCVACHQADYQREHSGSGYPTTCTTCHTTSGWGDVQADHALLSNGYVLEGVHDGLACGSCHTADGSGTLFNPTGPDDCVACHQADYQREHSGSGYPTSCLTCHTVTRWADVSADHVVLSNGFVLVGNHDQLACASCHIVPGMQSLFSPSDAEDCLACHLADFQREHSGTGYPGTCLTCHVVTSWAGAQFNHDAAFFPINSGKHQGQWTACTTCHTNPADYQVFTCLNCHKHEKAQTDADHSQVRDYVYESGQCLSCHPTGNS